MTLDVGFIGYGMMGEAHANALARLPMFFPETQRTNRSIIAGRNEESLAAAADRLGFDRTTTDWREVVDAVDVLYNLGPPNLHAEPTIAALESGVHVLCEKPLARTQTEAERMVAAAAESDAVAACGYNYRFVPALRLMKEFVDEGLLGDIRYFRGQYLQNWQADATDPWSWRNDSDLAGPGALADVGSHTIDLARWLVGDIVDVSGRLLTVIEERTVADSDDRRQVTNDDLYTAHFTFESGIQGMMEGSRVAVGHDNTNAIELIGSEGAVRFDCSRMNELQVQLPDDRGFQRINVTRDDDPYMDAWWPPGHGIGWEHTFVHETLEFLRAIDGKNSFAPGFADALRTERVVDAVQESHEAGRRVSL
ncbi:Gfo/Idh/MocA family protein [Haloarchaeobius sp. HRN-SO-5]|uniref:Gfo/Idh/MocA family protein n=1 Tax=Haloarchaeobius sp. HRN-SO-5 TaxID=3446118 RepID=UPI003EBD09EC